VGFDVKFEFDPVLGEVQRVDLTASERCERYNVSPFVVANCWVMFGEI